MSAGLGGWRLFVRSRPASVKMPAERECCVRFVLRFLSLLFLAAAVIVGIIDSIQSVAGETIALTPLGAALFSINPAILAAAESYFRAHISSAVWDTAVEWMLLQPAFLIFLIVSLLFWLLAYKRQPASRFAAR
jgi:hypothetical protein